MGRSRRHRRLARTTREYTHAHVLEILARQKALNYPPGAEYSYSNSGYNLAAILVPRVSGESLPAFTKREIFTPLGMTSTQWRDDFRRIVHNRAVAYSQRAGEFRQDMPFEDVYGNGGLLTTVGDLLRWNRNFTEMKVGGRALIDAQLERGRPTDGRVIAYAAGLMVLQYKGLHEVSHSGSTAGYSAWLGRYPDQSLSVAVLCNLAGTNATQLGHQVADLYLASALHPDPARHPSYEDPARAGLYRSLRDHSSSTLPAQPDSTFQFTGDRMRLVSEMDGGTWYEKVDRAAPTRAELETLTGDYASDEAEVTLRVSLEPAGLVIHRHPDAVFPLTPTYRDGFSSQLGSIRFLRDAAGRVIEMSIGEGRVWDLRCRLVQ